MAKVLLCSCCNTPTDYQQQIFNSASQPVLRNCCLRSARKKKSNWKDWSAQLNSGMQERCHPHLISRLPRQPHKMWAVVSKGFSGTALNCSQQPSNHRTTSQHWVAKAWSPEDKENLARWKKAPTCSDPSGSYPAKQQTPPCCPSARPSRSCLLHTHSTTDISSTSWWPHLLSSFDD